MLVADLLREKRHQIGNFNDNDMCEEGAPKGRTTEPKFDS